MNHATYSTDRHTYCHHPSVRGLSSIKCCGALALIRAALQGMCEVRSEGR
jgi:hypothetical protein